MRKISFFGESRRNRLLESARIHAEKNMNSFDSNNVLYHEVIRLNHQHLGYSPERQERIKRVLRASDDIEESIQKEFTPPYSHISDK